ncbi:MAG: TetR/AcrR family transcriptional regulator [Candidatus Binataceae bacterium]
MAEPLRAIVATPLNRFDRRREKTRVDLLQAAENVIARKGFHATRISDIADEADVGLGTFYLHFKTKNEVFAELVANGSEQLRAEIAQAKLGVSEPEQKLRITIATVLDAAAEHPELFRIVFGHSPAFLDLMVRVHEVFVNDLADDLRPALGARAALVAQLTVGMLSRAIEWLIAGDAPAIDELKDTTTNFALGGFARASARSAG